MSTRHTSHVTRYIPMTDELRITVEENDDNSYTLRTQRRVLVPTGAYAYQRWENMHTLRTTDVNGECDKDVVAFAFGNLMFNVYSEPV